MKIVLSDQIIMGKKILKSLCLSLLFSTGVYADGPLMSTDFFKAYQDIAAVGIAAEAGRLNAEICGYLDDESMRIDERLAIINALAWPNSNGNDGFSTYLDFLVLKYDSVTEKNYIEQLNSHQLICLAYLRAQDENPRLESALELAREAINKNKDSYSLLMIRALMLGQMLHDEYEENKVQIEGRRRSEYVYAAVVKVESDLSLVRDMRQDAVNIIFKHAGLGLKDVERD